MFRLIRIPTPSDSISSKELLENELFSLRKTLNFYFLLFKNVWLNNLCNLLNLQSWYFSLYRHTESTNFLIYDLREEKNSKTFLRNSLKYMHYSRAYKLKVETAKEIYFFFFLNFLP